MRSNQTFHMDPTASNLLRQIAAADGRTVGQTLERLIQEAFDKRFPEAVPVEARLRDAADRMNIMLQETAKLLGERA